MAQGNVQGTKTVNKEIDDYMKSKVGRKEMNTIIAAYVTFNTEEGHDEAQNYIREPRKYVNIQSILNDQMMNKFLSGVGFLKNKTYDKLNINHLKLLGQTMQFKQAGIPSNIIWENKSISPFEKSLRWFACIVVVITMSIIAFSFIIKIKIESNELNSEYMNTNCEQLYNQFTDNEILELAAYRYVEE